MAQDRVARALDATRRALASMEELLVIAGRAQRQAEQAKHNLFTLSQILENSNGELTEEMRVLAGKALSEVPVKGYVEVPEVMMAFEPGQVQGLIRASIEVRMKQRETAIEEQEKAQRDLLKKALFMSKNRWNPFRVFPRI